MTSPGRRWVWYGGRPSLDFVNTRRNREAGRRDGAAGDGAAGDGAAGDGAAEYLHGPADLAAWLHAAGLAEAGPGEAGLAEAGPGEAELGEAGLRAADPAGVGPVIDDETFAGALALREAIDAALTATVTGGSVPAGAVRYVNEWLALAPERPVLRIEAGVPVLSAPAGRTPRGALALIATDAAELLGTGLRERLRICPGPGCRGRFLDDSPAGRRRWCSMAVCGNRNKAAAYRQAAHLMAGRS